ncbi:MAG TPA: GNAT family N-acetyltransferase [Clostridia bacterium]|nr:GNAT family N-acetyltransferase [Clostridia bacterium]
MATGKKSSVLDYKPLGPATWADFEELFGSRGACGGCWCMSWRLSRADFNSGKGERNKALMRGAVIAGENPGILLYEDGQAIGWCSLGPRETFPALERSRVWKPVDDKPVWSISCFFVRKGYRTRGVSVTLLQAAIDFARKSGAKILEGYPQELEGKKLPDVFVWTGLAASYRKAGFEEAARRSAAKPIMRYEL